MKRSILLIGLLVVVLAALPLVAAAQDAPVEGDLFVAGAGAIEAQGTGKAVIAGYGTATVSGTGKLVIRDLDRDAQITLDGEGQCVEKNLNGDTYKLVCRGWQGSATVSEYPNAAGTTPSFKLKIVGVNLDLYAEGTGKVKLKGDGDYTVFDQDGNPLATGVWQEKVTKIRLGDGA